MTILLRLLIFLSLACITLQILICGSRIKANAFGKPPIPWPGLVLAKLAAAVSILFLVMKAVRGGAEPPLALSVLSLCLLCAAIAIFSLALPRLGSSLRVGIPQEDTKLVTSGIYAVSRNPIYLAVFCFMGASLTYAFSWINLASAVIAFVLHHCIVIREEKFLSARFAEYEAYRKRVRRYF